MTVIEQVQLMINDVLGMLVHAGSSASSNAALGLGFF